MLESILFGGFLMKEIVIGDCPYCGTCFVACDLDEQKITFSDKEGNTVSPCAHLAYAYCHISRESCGRTQPGGAVQWYRGIDNLWWMEECSDLLCHMIHDVRFDSQVPHDVQHPNEGRDGVIIDPESNHQDRILWAAATALYSFDPKALILEMVKHVHP
jgi:hypothetical protein